MKLTKQLKSAIITHALDCYPAECCGVIVNDNYIPCTNTATDNEQFILCPKDFAKAEAQGDIQAIVHSHPDGGVLPSDLDKLQIELGYIDVPTQDDVLGFIHYDASVTDNLGLRYAFSDAVGLSYRGKVRLKNGGARYIFASHYYMSDTRLEQYRVYFFGRYIKKAKVGLTTYDTDGNITYTSDGHALKLKKVISPLYVPKNKVDKQKVIESLDLVSYAGMYHTLAQELGIDSGRYDDETCIQKMLKLISQKYANPNFSFKTGNRPNEFANKILKAAMGLDDSQPELAWFYRTLGDCNYHLMQQGRKYATSLSTTGLTHQYDTNGLWHIIYVGFTPLGLNSGIIYTGAIHNHMFYQEPIEVYERIIRYAGRLEVSYYSHGRWRWYQLERI